MSTGFQFSGMAFGGPLPLLAGLLVTTAGGGPWLLVAYIGLVGLVSTIGALMAPTDPKRLFLDIHPVKEKTMSV
jgi:hypothetical protein